MTCELICKCSFLGCESLAENYCKGNPTICSRRRVALTVGSEHVPEDLHPDQSHRVLDIVFKNADSSFSA